ncbi:MAG: DUF2304 domain-containing protein [bacterium]|nr:DUF2304 domain-containing protein [bacterium]
MNRIQIITTIISIFFLLGIINLVRKKRLQEAYSLLWILSAVVFLIISIWPELLWSISRLVGIYYGPSAMLLLLCGFLILICIQFSIVISKRSIQIKTLTQELALIKNDIENLKDSDS